MDDHPEYGIPCEDLPKFSGIIWRETEPHSGRYVAVVPTPPPQSGATWPQVVIVLGFFATLCVFFLVLGGAFS
jgi:hypothetical protein